MAVELSGCSVFGMNYKTDIPNASIFILENADTVYRGQSDEYGKFNIQLVLDKSKKWKALGRAYCGNTEITLYVPKDSSMFSSNHITFYFDLLLLKSCTLGYSTVYYEMNTIDHSIDEDVIVLSGLIKEYPAFNLEFFQTISQKENPEVAKKRMEAFKLLLEKNNVPITNITFSDKVFYIDEYEPDQRARIQCGITSWGN